MALSPDETELVYEVLDIPNRTDVLVVNGRFGTGTSGQHGAVLTTKTLIDQRLAALSTSQETRVRALTVEWATVSTSGVRLAPNAANEGIDRNPARERTLIKRRMARVLGVFRETDSDGGVPLG
jgi:hypothetical protein